MTRYERGFLTKCAERGVSPERAADLLASSGEVSLSPESVSALNEMLRMQRDEYERRRLQRKARLGRNRKEQVDRKSRDWMLSLGAGGGLLGAWAGSGTAASLPLAVGGAILGAIGGRAHGRRRGNEIADEMECIEDETGVDVAQQAIDRNVDRSRKLLGAHVFSQPAARAWLRRARGPAV